MTFCSFHTHLQESKNKKGAVPRLSDAHETRLKVPQLKVNAKGQSESEGKNAVILLQEISYIINIRARFLFH